MISRIIIPIVLQLAAIGVIIAEFILPSFGILTVIALSLVAYSLFLAFTTLPNPVGIIFVVADVILVPVLVLVGLKLFEYSPANLRKTLGSEASDGSSNQDDFQRLLQKNGTVITDLRPSGTILIEGKKYDAISSGDYIGKGATIVVVEVIGNKITVKKV